MTQEEQRIAIAIACGAKRRLWHCASHWFLSFDESIPLATESWSQSEGARKHWIDTLPDYPNDLNAMHEAENALPVPLRSFYCDWLMYGMVNPPDDKATIGRWQTINATTKQRAEAFLRTIGKWKD